MKENKVCYKEVWTKSSAANEVLIKKFLKFLKVEKIVKVILRATFDFRDQRDKN